MKSAPLLWSRPEVPTDAPENSHEDEHRDFDDSVLQKIVGLSRARAWEIVGGLSRPSKMPCYSWGIPAQTCITGSKLAQIEGSVCQSCYALKGYYRTHRVQRAYQRRLDRSTDPRWVEAMVKLIYWQTAETGTPYFRWFDSGDLQSVEMLRSICTVAIGTPEIRHWLPTREYRIVEAYLASELLPANLVVRVSAALVDAPTPQVLGLPTSTVHTTDSNSRGEECLAYASTPPNCGECRSCWDQAVANVSYRLH